MIAIQNKNMSTISYWKIGGNAKQYFVVDDEYELKEAIKLADQGNIKPLIVGNMTNLLFSDGTLEIGVIKLGTGFSSIKRNGFEVTVGSSATCQQLVRFCMKEDLVGLEHIVGIPATIGGLVYMNGGSQRKTVSERLVSVTSINTNGDIIHRNNADCNFDYRKSIFQDKNIKETIISATFILDEGDGKLSRTECLEILKSRNKKFPRKEPNCGSVFISNPIMYKTFGPPGQMIEEAKLKGVRFGGAEISRKHANFITNLGNAKSDDILSLVDFINKTLNEKYGITLESEALFVSELGELVPLHLAKAHAK